jgi:uncharacterized phage-associated protein
MSFSEIKAAQVAAFFAFKADGSINVLKLMKLMYLSERKSYEEFGEPIIGDHLVSMDQGPVLSKTFNCFNGAGSEDVWGKWISAKSGYQLGLVPTLKDPSKQLGVLSRAELTVLDSVWQQFGSMDQWALVEYTHDHCDEWEDPHGSSAGIPLERLLKALKFNHGDRSALIARFDEHSAVDRILAAAR